MDVEPIRRLAERAADNIERVIVGKRGVIDLLLVALLCEGHVLVEDVPGTGKTMLAKSVARTLDCSFRRIQFTPDLLPSDVTGVSFFNQRTQEFEFRAGPIFSQVVLADEINRATPRTQSALLECMEERQVSLEGETRLLPRPFLVLATQNPIELEGTFPLPEAQLDRFFLRLSVGYPSDADEKDVVRRFRMGSPLDELPAVISVSELAAMQRLVRAVHVSEAVEDYVVRLVRATRLHAALELGASPRATLALYRASQALAGLQGRGYVLPDDVKLLAAPVLSHRLIASAQSRLRGRGAADILTEILGTVPVPVE
ncbi:MAG: MoxR family ATPase [Chloroflexi bacterium]|nr:MoxR family ATPase [Chloroflexota bacterium]MBV9596317.1 MoxR family ATPase [Chloroflexota bacterium]